MRGNEMGNKELAKLVEAVKTWLEIERGSPVGDRDRGRCWAIVEAMVELGLGLEQLPDFALMHTYSEVWGTRPNRADYDHPNKLMWSTNKGDRYFMVPRKAKKLWLMDRKVTYPHREKVAEVIEDWSGDEV